jgi:hypothetical protein
MFCLHKLSKTCLFVLTLYYSLLHNPVTRRDPDVPAFPLWWVKLIHMNTEIKEFIESLVDYTLHLPCPTFEVLFLSGFCSYLYLSCISSIILSSLFSFLFYKLHLVFLCYLSVSSSCFLANLFHLSLYIFKYSPLVWPYVSDLIRNSF